MHPTSSPRHLAGLDLLRGLAFLLVLAFHDRQPGAPEAFLAVARWGWMGVDIFFVLSGLLIGTQLFLPLTRGETPALGPFYVRRALRILPAFWAVLALYLALPGLREAELVTPAWRFLTFTQNLGLRTNAFSHAWSLCVEEHFYLALPLLVLALRRARVRTVVGVLGLVLVGGVVVRGASWWNVLRALPPDVPLWKTFNLYVYYPTWSRLDGLALGVGLALVRVFRPAWWARWTRAAWAPALLAVGALALAMALCEGGYTLARTAFAFPLIALGFAGLVVALAGERASAVCARIPGVRALATLTYTLYLSHKLVLHGVRELLGPYGHGPYAPLTLLLQGVGMVALALALHHLVERPGLALRDRLLERVEPTPATAA